MEETIGAMLVGSYVPQYKQGGKQSAAADEEADCKTQ